MDPLTRWEAAAISDRGRRPRPGTGGRSTIDLRNRGELRAPAPPPAAEPDTLLVPLDAWNRMLAQLGNLHEAGRELADARERAAKAETEVDFLRERVADLRERLAELSPPAESADRAQPAPDPAPRPAPGPVRRLVHTTYAELRSRVRR